MTVVAIDGPSGSGKSTISRRLAEELNMAYLDTGAMYRAATWWCINQMVDLNDHDATAALVQTIPWRISTDPKNPRFIVDDIDITTAIRTTEISTKVSDVARNLEVRAWMKDQQRQIIHQSPQGIIAEGRDITTVVAPDADVRILLIADEEARLARRAKQLHGTDNGAAMAATLDQVARRDRDDSTVSNFLEAADGVVTIDSTELSLQDTIEAVRNLIV